MGIVHSPRNHGKASLPTIFGPQIGTQKLLKTLKLNSSRKPARDVMHMRRLKNISYNSQLTCKRKVLMMPNVEFALQPLKAPIPHGGWQKTNSEENPKISKNRPRENIRPSKRDPI